MKIATHDKKTGEYGMIAGEAPEKLDSENRGRWNTILGQLTRTPADTSARPALATLHLMLAAHDYMGMPRNENHDTGVFFMFKGGRGRHDAATIILEHSDTYTVTVYKWSPKAGRMEIKDTRADVFCDELTEAFYSMTALCTTLPQIRSAI